jgi:hypothetical protein
MTPEQYKAKILRLLSKLKSDLLEAERLVIIAEIEEMLEALLPA